MNVGEIEILGLSDGEFMIGPEYFGPKVTFAGHESLLDPDGKMHLPIGCFVLRGGPIGQRTVLIDAGLGEISGDTVIGGRLMRELAAHEISTAEIDLIVCTHLHIDHCGWLVDSKGEAIFPNATIWTGGGDWTRFVVDEADFMLDHVRHGLRQLRKIGRVELIEGDTDVVAGVSALAAPGHTPGHVILVISHDTERAVLLGDAISCPAQLDETDWGAISDVDPDLARRTRERLWRELESSGTAAVGAHFPDLQFGRVLRGGAARRWF